MGGAGLGENLRNLGLVVSSGGVELDTQAWSSEERFGPERRIQETLARG